MDENESLTLRVLRTVREADAEPVMVRDVAARLGFDVESTDLHPVRQVLNHLSRNTNGIERAGNLGSFRYYRAAANIDTEINRRADRQRAAADKPESSDDEVHTQ